jgi:hypothetical protein
MGRYNDDYEVTVVKPSDIEQEESHISDMMAYYRKHRKDFEKEPKVMKMFMKKMEESQKKVRNMKDIVNEMTGKE